MSALAFIVGAVLGVALGVRFGFYLGERHVHKAILALVYERAEEVRDDGGE